MYITFLFNRKCDVSKVKEILTDENVLENTDGNFTLLHIACLSGSKF